MHFTEEELAIAKSVDLCQVAASLGYTVKRVGRYHTLKEMDSIRIYQRTHWFRWSRKYDRGENGGSQIDFLKVFAGLEVKEAVFWLLDFAGYHDHEKEHDLKHQVVWKKEESKKEFILPEASPTNHYLYRYLNHTRCISKEVIDFFVNAGLIYESKQYHNIVFKGNDKDGITRFASMRGVFDREGKSFKCDVAGNDKNYGFNVMNNKSTTVIVFEAAIDLMSFIEAYRGYDSNKLALGMLSDAPLVTFLKEHPQVRTIQLCLDNDAPGREATLLLRHKYEELGYQVIDSPPPALFKDYNEWLVSEKTKPVEEYAEHIMVKNGLTR